MFGYKVVRKISPSIMISATPLGIETQYRIGEKTVRTKRMGPFAVFEGLVLAQIFAEKQSRHNYDTFYILECEYQPSESSRMWKWDGVVPHWLSIEKAPVSTVLADWVKPIKKIGLVMRGQLVPIEE